CTWNPHFSNEMPSSTQRSKTEAGYWHTTRKFFLQYDQRGLRGRSFFPCRGKRSCVLFLSRYEHQW
ncbi:MAG: hypothetical protein ACKN9U_25335, partial [Pirellulaceae bacterium]